MKYVIILLCLFSLISLNLYSSDEAPSSEEKPIRKTVKRVPRNQCVASDEALRDIAQKKKEIEDREKKIAEQLLEITEKEKIIEQQIKQLEDLKKEISIVQAESDSKAEEKINKLVETMEKMSPKKASELLSSLNNKLAVEGMMRLSADKLAKVMNLMDVKRSSQLSELLTRIKETKKTTHKEGVKNDSRNPAEAS